MSHFIKTTRCPKCQENGGDRTGNNLAIYSDGHEWCYACGYYKPSSLIEKYKDTKAIRLDNNEKWFTPAPVFHNTGYTWLKKYALTNQEIEDNFFWDDKGYCVFNVVGFQNGRNFSGEGPKYKTKGNIKGNEYVFKGMGDELLSSIVIVEDAISAIKVSRVCSAVAIHNSIIPLELILRLAKDYKHLFIWLDPDKSKEVLKEATKASPYFSKVSIIWSEKDPKVYNETEIKEKLCDRNSTPEVSIKQTDVQ